MEDIFIAQYLNVPTNTTEALKDPTWRKSMDKEYEALIEKKVWDVVFPSPDTNIVRSRWAHICNAMRIGH